MTFTPTINADKGDILQDPFETGKKYVGTEAMGLGNLVATGQPFNYGFVLYDELAGIIQPVKQVILPFPPEAITIDEPAATSIVHTQNSGRWIERRGQLSKTITISGTTGYNYNPQLFPIARQFLTQSAIVDEEGPNSGFGRFLQLRNIFREYWMTFSNEDFKDIRATTALAFLNEKDDEAWIVEPISFRMTRQTPKNKFTYNYDIVMQTIAPLDGAGFTPDPLSLVESVGNVVTVVSNVASEMTRLTASVGNAVSTATGVVSEALNGIASTAQNVITNLENVKEGVDSFLGLKDVIQGHKDAVVSSWDGMRKTWMGHVENLDDVSETVIAETGEDPITFEVRQDILEMTRLISLLAGREELFAPSFRQNWEAAIANMNLKYGLNNYDYLKNVLINSGGVQEVEIQPYDTIYRIAANELGSADRFHEIVILNNLKPPYISQDADNRAPNTLSPGDAILVPATGVLNASRVPITTNIYPWATYKGAVTSMTGSIQINFTLTDSDDWKENQWAGSTVEVISNNAANGQLRIVASSTTTGAVVLTTAFDTNPQPGDLVKIYLSES